MTAKGGRGKATKPEMSVIELVREQMPGEYAGRVIAELEKGRDMQSVARELLKVYAARDDYYARGIVAAVRAMFGEDMGVDYGHVDIE